MKKDVIFCVDDEKIVLNSLKTELKNAFGNKYIIETAESGTEALEAIENLMSLGYKIQVVIADYAMPVMKGDEFLMNLHSKSPETLNILLTGQATIEGVINSINHAGLYRYISKPWHTNDLVLTVKQALKSYDQENQLKVQNEALKELSASLENKVQLRTQELKNNNILLLEKQQEIILQNKELETYRNHLENLVKERTLDLTIAKDNAEESDRLKSEFLSTMSHELRTPLNSIIGLSGLVDRDTSMDEVIEYTQIINNSGEHLLKLIDDLFNVSLIESGKTKVNIKDIDLGVFMNEIHGNMKIYLERLKKEHIDFNLVIPEIHKNLTIYTDKLKLTNILVNLLRNAIKFSENGTINYGFRICEKHEQKYIVFFVSDTGIGIDKKYQDLIFKSFTQVNSDLNRPYEGAGVGLTIAKKLVNLLKGDIWLDSTLGEGSSFFFTIPLYDVNNEMIRNNCENIIKSPAEFKNER
ncbi:hybrid sensor histidine kinase/response regulator [Algibacter lectus]|uniref:histidine kinase n=1 Tax=Algibacter lectus TaxID=221126 RepID=A0A4R8MGJ0_9FLAO|nr:ATP-binding protein [Algibacter lectus]MWW23844.1 response regulator [Algibacter lectus]TDY63472.1 signal transduction histidine kinase [Algibacter lectus]